MRKCRIVRVTCSWMLRICGLLFLLFIGFGLLGIPSCITGLTSGKEYKSDETPDTIVVLGGGGIPSESGLIRTYHGAELAELYPNANIVVSLPSDEDPETDHVGLMKQELVMRGVDRDRVLIEYRAHNTHYQAVEVYKLLGEAAVTGRVAVVTSPGHVKRAVLAFRAAGFGNAYGYSADSEFPDADIGPGATIRYIFWARLQSQVHIAQESAAILYYRLRGWI